MVRLVGHVVGGGSQRRRHRQRGIAAVRNAALTPTTRRRASVWIGRELYFWSFIVALLLFGLGCVASVLEGIDHIRYPHPVEHPGVIYTVLALSVLFEGSTWVIA